MERDKWLVGVSGQVADTMDEHNWVLFCLGFAFIDVFVDECVLSFGVFVFALPTRNDFFSVLVKKSTILGIHKKRKRD